jgi:hypothetical protein
MKTNRRLFLGVRFRMRARRVNPMDGVNKVGQRDTVTDVKQ